MAFHPRWRPATRALDKTTQPVLIDNDWIMNPGSIVERVKRRNKSARRGYSLTDSRAF
jgi:hypothetical protein